MRITNLVRSMVLALLLAMLAAACSGSSSSSTGSPAASADSQDVSGQTTATIGANNFFFSPSTLVGTAGQTLTITVKNEGAAPHSFTIDGQSVDVTVQPGTQQDVTVTFPTSGSVEFYCRFHVATGMKGELTVG